MKRSEIGSVASATSSLSMNHINRETVDLDMNSCGFYGELRILTSETTLNACEIVKPASRKWIGRNSGARR